MNLTPEEFSSEHVQNLLKSKKIIVSRMEETLKKKWKPEHEERSGTETPETEETIQAEESVVSEQEKEQEEIHEPEPKKAGYVRKKK